MEIKTAVQNGCFMQGKLNLAGDEGVVQPIEDDEECDIEAIRSILDEDGEQSSW